MFVAEVVYVTNFYILDINGAELVWVYQRRVQNEKKKQVFVMFVYVASRADRCLPRYIR